MDDNVKRAEELLEERMRSQRTNGHPAEEQPEREAEAHADTTALTRDLQRLAADFANYRKRNEAERTDFAKYAKAELIRKLLEVLDGYDRALETMPEEVKGQAWVEGMWLVERKLRGLLDAEGLQTLEAVGRPFDPYQHEAVAHVESDAPEGTVISEYQKGYRLHDRIIRPAVVTVSKGPPTADDEVAPGAERERDRG